MNDSRSQLLTAALAILDTDGIDAVTVRRLGTEAHFHRSSIAHHFPTMGNLYDEMWEVVAAEVAGVVPTTSRDERYGAAMLEYWQTHRHRLEFLCSPPRIACARSEALLGLAAALWEIGPSDDAVIVAKYSLGILASAVNVLFELNNDESRRAALRDVAFVAALRVRPLLEVQAQTAS